MNPDHVASFHTQINTAQRILITAHQFPDMDALGSCIALAHLLTSHAKKDVKVWIPKEKLAAFEWLPLESFICHDYPQSFVFDTCIVCDCSHLDRVDHHHLLKQATHPYITINIDHHPDNSSYGDINLVYPVSSVGELLYTLFDALQWPLSPAIARCLYAAIYFDTGRFAYSNVTEHTLAAASALIHHGASSFETFQHLDENKSERDMQVIKIALDHLVVNHDYDFAYTTLPKNTPRSSVKVIDFIRQIKDIELFIVFQELQTNMIKVNLRSKHTFNVSKLAQTFGGGGHERASGIVFHTDLASCKLELMGYIRSR